MKPMRRTVGFALLLGACSAVTPSWFPGESRVERAGAYEWFLIATGSSVGRNRTDACETADLGARNELTKLLIERAETKSDVVAAAGGPSRIRQVLTAFAIQATTMAPRTRELFDDSSRRCYVELRWLLPRHLAAAVRRTVDQRTTEEDVGEELRKALRPAAIENDSERIPVAIASKSRTAITARSAVDEAYAGWYIRILSVPECDTHRVAFVGAPGGSEQRWLELKKNSSGWLIIGDERVSGETWPSPPSVDWCD